MPSYSSPYTLTKRGKAAIEGIVGTFTAIIYPIVQSGKLTSNWDEEVVKDNLGFDVAWRARNLHYLSDFGFKLLADTAANAATGSVLLAPYATVTLSSFDATSFNGTYQNISGGEIDLGNTKVGDLSVKLRRYDDATQAALSVATPT